MSTILQIPKTRFLPTLATRHLIGGAIDCLVLLENTNPAVPKLTGADFEEGAIAGPAKVIWTPAGLTVKLASVPQPLAGGAPWLTTWQILFNSYGPFLG